MGLIKRQMAWISKQIDRPSPTWNIPAQQNSKIEQKNH